MDFDENFGGMGCGQRNNILDFGGNPDPVPYCAPIFPPIVHFSWRAVFHYYSPGGSIVRRRYPLYRMLSRCVTSTSQADPGTGGPGGHPPMDQT